MSLFRFVESLGFSFPTFFHDAVALSTALQLRITQTQRYGYVYCNVLTASPAQMTTLTYHLTGSDITNSGLQYWLKKGMEDISDAFRTQKIPFLDIQSGITDAEWAEFMEDASPEHISERLLNFSPSCYVHNGEEIQFFLSEFGNIETVELEGSTGVAVQITLQHYAPHNIASLS